MLAKVPPKRRDGESSFLKLVSYTTLRDDLEMGETLSPEKPFVRKSRAESVIFNDLVGYATRNPLPNSADVIATFPDGRQQLRCGDVLTETNCFSLPTAASEMNMVAMQNAHCKDPVYHVILSWPEAEKPTPEQVFDSARHCMKALGMADHQYVFAIHDDTDNLHCHMTVNRVNPKSYRAASLYNDHFTLDRCCREMELKYKWQHVNGAFMVNDDGAVVRKHHFFKPVPSAVRELEIFKDMESLYSYAVEQCRNKLDKLFLQDGYDWADVHNIMIAAGLELRPKGEGLAVYDLANESQHPVKASHIHPELTLQSQQELIGKFTPAAVIREVNQAGKEVLLTPVNIQSQYDCRLHSRDRGARAERRVQRAMAREDLIARYKAYKNGFERKTITADEVRTRYRELAASYRIRKNNVRQTQRDPLLRKLMYRALEIDKLKSMAALRLEIRAEREALKAMPGNSVLSYRAWVEAQATRHDTAAISQLRGWAYREKRKNRTPAISNNIVLHAVADDIKPAQIRGYDVQVKRDGAVVYMSGNKPVLLDRGLFMEIATAPEEKGKNVAMALHITNQKSGERVEVRGEKEFVSALIKYVPKFNHDTGKKVYLTHPAQRQMAGYNIPEPVQRPTPRLEPENRPTPPRAYSAPKP